MPENENNKSERGKAFIDLIITCIIMWALSWIVTQVISEIDKSGGLKCVLAEFWENGTGKNCGK